MFCFEVTEQHFLSLIPYTDVDLKLNCVASDDLQKGNLHYLQKGRTRCLGDNIPVTFLAVALVIGIWKCGW